MNEKIEIQKRFTRGEALKYLRINEIIEEYSGGGYFIPVFIHIDEKEENSRKWFWMSPWLFTEEAVIKKYSDLSKNVEVYSYLQHGFHPSLVNFSGRVYYESIYGKDEEPLVLGWSEDSHKLHPKLSSEFIRYYQLSKEIIGNKTIYNFWQEGIENVAEVETDDSVKNKKIKIVRIKREFLENYLIVRNRWLVCAIWGQYAVGDVPIGGEVKHCYHSKKLQEKEYFFRCIRYDDKRNPGDIQIEGFCLRFHRPPKKITIKEIFNKQSEYLTGKEGQNITFLTSYGKVKPYRARNERNKMRRFFTTVVFDQEVLCKYQNDPNTEIEVLRPHDLRIQTKYFRTYRSLLVLGTEYISCLLGYFTEEMPEVEWKHWQQYNLPWIGSGKHRNLIGKPTFSDLVSDIIKWQNEINLSFYSLFNDFSLSIFNLDRPADKEIKHLSSFLPRRVSNNEFIARARSLNSLIVERLDQSRLVSVLLQLGLSKRFIETEDLKSIKCLTAILIIVSLSKGKKKTDIKKAVNLYKKWVNRQNINSEENDCISKVLSITPFLDSICALRQKDSHLSGDVNSTIKKALSKLAIGISDNEYRSACVDLYYRAIDFFKQLCNLINKVETKWRK